MNSYDFDIRSYTKSELARQYNPDLSLPRARQILYRWITANRQLYDELVSCGYREKVQILTPRQVQLIVQYLGEP